MAGMYKVAVRKEGPIFDGRAEAAVDAAMERTIAALAVQGSSIIKTKAAKYNKSGRSTGYAPSTVRTVITPVSARIFGQSQRGVIWWPWLEGVSKRNETRGGLHTAHGGFIGGRGAKRFPGYHSFRLARRIISKRAGAVMEAKLAEAAPEMGGAP